MINMSQLRHAVVLLPLLALTSGCEGHGCTAIGCLEGLVVALDDTFEAGRNYAIEMDEVTTTPEVVPFMTCDFVRGVPGTIGHLRCQSSVNHSELENMILVRDYQPKMLLIKVSSDGTSLGQRTFEPIFMSKEINGPGCGVCTNALITMSVP